MNLMLKMACRVIEWRMQQGEQLDAILSEYPRLTQAEILQIRETLRLL